MSQIPFSIPRTAAVGDLLEDPLGFLGRARSLFGDIFVIRDGGPIFSRAADCTGAIAVFGSAYHQAVLSDIDSFALPISAARRLSLPQTLVNLNCGLHSMRGEQHARHQRLLMHVLSEHATEDHNDAVRESIEAFLASWRYGQTISLLDEMRRLAAQVSTRLLFGDHFPESFELASLLQSYFHLRREASSPFATAAESLREDLIALGTSLDDALRRYARWRRKSHAPSDGLLTRLALAGLESGDQLSDDELVAHSNVLFMSSTEPIAISLTWVLLVLSQLPALRRDLRNELDRTFRADAASPDVLPPRSSLLGSVINETLRLLPPNALMVRVTTQATSLNALMLPERCELVLCPFLAHRDPERFPRPNEFMPSRWAETRPSPFEYFPFGAGGHSCVGRHLAMYLINSVLALLIPRYDLVLAGDQEIDWRVHIQFMPRNDPSMIIGLPADATTKFGKLFGPVGDLLVLNGGCD